MKVGLITIKSSRARGTETYRPVNLLVLLLRESLDLEKKDDEGKKPWTE